MSDTTYVPDAHDVTRWWWIRHAPVVDAHLKRLSGQRDVPADTSDAAAFQRLAEHLPLGAQWIVTNLQRTRQTAEALWAAGAECVEPLVEPAFAEQAFGDWSGLTWDDIAARSDAQAFWDAPADTTPPTDQTGQKAESFADQCARVAARMDDLSAALRGRDVVCVAHGGAIRAALVHAFGLTPFQALSVEVPNLGLTRLDHIPAGLKSARGGHWRVVAVNQVW